MKHKPKLFVMVRSYQVTWMYRGYDQCFDAYMQKQGSVILVAKSCVQAKQLALPLMHQDRWKVRVKLFSEVECKAEKRL